ncbi:MAG: hypothetical protein ACFE9L_16220 [Candidatus Hodarchaeota archaeon]
MSNEDKIYQKPLTKEQREKIISALPEKVFFCKWCGRTFYSIQRLENHLKHTSYRPGAFSCYICNKVLFSKTGLLTHLKYFHYIDRNDHISLIFNIYREEI